MGSPPNWHPDPFRRYEYRFHNGSTWTADVSANGVRMVDPLGSGPAAGGAPVRAVPFAERRARRDGLATASMVLGIVGLTTSWIPVLFVAGAVCAVLAVIFGVIALRRRKAENRSFAMAGAITGGAGILMVGVGVWTTSIVIDAVDDFANPPPASVNIVHCRVEDSVLVVTGEIENLGTRTSDYRILLDVTGLGGLDRHVVVTVADVHPGAIGEFEVPVRDLGILDDASTPGCRVDDITGPLPFGIDVDAN